MYVDECTVVGVLQEYDKFSLDVFKSNYGVFVVDDGVPRRRIMPDTVRLLEERDVVSYEEKMYDIYTTDERLFFPCETVDTFNRSVCGSSFVFNYEMAFHVGGMVKCRDSMFSKNSNKGGMVEVYETSFEPYKISQREPEYVTVETLEEVIEDGVERVNVIR